MKGKPLKHKTSNTFRFKSFSERVCEIDVRHAALYQIEHANAERPSENETYTTVTIRRWRHLNLTEGFKSLCRDLGEVKNIAQILLRKDEIINVVSKRLEQPDILWLQPLLEILVSLSKDLRGEFYTHFPRILELLFRLLETKNGDQLEWTMICLAFLFKSLRQHLVRDILGVFKKILPLLSDTQPQFMVNFAAESFAYVVRDVKDKKMFLNAMLKQLQHFPQATTGCGHLVLEIIRGVPGKFHSCAEQFLTILFENLQTETSHRETMFQILTQAVSDMLYTIEPKESGLFWNCVIKYMEKHMHIDGEPSLKIVLKLVGQALEYKRCKFLTNSLDLILVLIKVITFQQSEEVLKICSRIGILILMSSSLILTQEHASILIRTLLSTPYPQILIDFAINTIDHPHFDVMILPHYINFVVSTDFESESIQNLAKICCKKSTPCINGINLFEWVKYPIDFGKNTAKFVDKLSAILLSDDLNVNDLTSFVILSSHVKIIDGDNALATLADANDKFLDKLNGNERDNRYASYCIGIILESMIHISNFRGFTKICPIDKYLDKLLVHSNDYRCLSCLHVLDLYLSAYEHEIGLNLDILETVDPILKDNLSSPYHEIRLLTTHIYSLFEKIETIKETTLETGNTEDSYKVMSMCHTIESIKPSVHDYRAQVNLLLKMSFNSIQYNLAQKTVLPLHSLEYFFGILYNNFKLLWEPIIEQISGYANGLKSEFFWPIFLKKIQRSFKYATNKPKSVNLDEDIDELMDFVGDLYKQYNDIEFKIDFDNHRALLLQSMSNFVQVCEEKNRDLVLLFTDFVENEYKKDFNKRSVFTNVLKHERKIDEKMDIDELDTTTDNTVDNIDDTVEDDDNNVTFDDMDKETHENSSKDGKAIFKTLLNIMQLLSKFKNPRGLYKETYFSELYMEFLLHKNSLLQKYALECVLNYKNKSIVQYKDNLINLIDDKKFKDELIAFRITKDADNINTNDRTTLMPIILRILYSKMVSKVGTDKKSGQSKRAFIMRQLAGCESNEVLKFIEIAFPHFKKYIFMEVMDVYEDINKNIDLKCVISPAKLFSTLNLIEVIREYQGGYMDDNLIPNLLKIFYSVITIMSSILKNDDQVYPGFLKMVKNLRILALNFIAKFFNQFDKYVWSSDEIFVIFQTLIWPLLPKLPIEGIHNPTALLKLFNIWSLNPRYFVCFVACDVDNAEMTPLPYILKLLHTKTNNTVTNMILDMIERLLTFVENEDDKEIAPIKTFSIKELSETNIELNFGSKILLPHVGSILEILKKRFCNAKKSKTVNKRDLLILSRVTEMVTDPDTSKELLKLLVPILVTKMCYSLSEDNTEHALTTINNLLNKSTSPEMYLKELSPLFNKVSAVNMRKMLCNILNVIAERASDEKYKDISNLICEMNANNTRWIEQPDFDRRLDAYKQIYKLNEDNNISLDLAILIVYNCFYFIRTEKDIALRDSATTCLKKILPKLMMKYRSVDGLVFTRETVLSLICAGIKDVKNERNRMECLTILGVLTRECPDADAVLTDLSILTCHEDREVDFFDNICHLQMHRRVRALQRAVKMFKKCQKNPSPRTLTNFLLPLAAMFLCQEDYTDKNTLIDSCIDVVATCCRLLPWYHYELILKFYLNKLKSTEYRKQLTRLVVAILDAFHFDLTKCSKFELPKNLLSNLDRETALAVSTPEQELNEDVDMEGTENQEASEEQITETDLLPSPDLDDPEGCIDPEARCIDHPQDVTSKLPAYERVQVMSQSVSKRILKSVTSGLLPQLNRAISKLTEHDASHKLNRKKTSIERQEEDIVKVPIALALVKLLQKLPEDILKANLPSIFIKICSFLKSPLKQVRIVAREILRKIMTTIGPKYLNMLLHHLTALLTRGFQVHVLVATLHTVLDTLKDDLKPEHIDPNLDYILDISKNDLFGSLSEEKEVEKLGYKTPEAKPSKKTYGIIFITAQNVSEKCFVELLLPFKEVLKVTNSKKIVLKVQEAFLNIATGLVTNKFVVPENLFIFSYGVASESIPELVLGVPKRDISEKQRESMLRARPDCFLIPEVPKKTHIRAVVTSQKTNCHILVEFSLNLLHSLLKREKLSRCQVGPFIDPLVRLLADSLKSQHVKVTTTSLKCLSTIFVMRLDTPSLRENIADIVSATFEILHKYATLGINRQDDNFLLVKSAFKAITSLVRNIKYHILDENQLRTLLLYAEEDLENTAGKPANSLGLLRSILDAKLDCQELTDVMLKIVKMAVVNENSVVREDCRNLFTLYLSNYKVGKKLERHMELLGAQLCSELTYGRESVLALMRMLVEKLPLSTVEKHSSFLLVSLGRSLVWESESRVKASSANCIEVLLKRVRLEKRHQLFQATMAFLNERKASLIELGAQLSSRFVQVEGADFKKRMSAILPRLVAILSDADQNGAGKFVRVAASVDDEEEESGEDKDHSLIQVLMLVHKICVNCPAVFKSDTDSLDEIAQRCQVFLAHPHSWVRLSSVRILSAILSSIDPSELSNENVKNRQFIYSDSENGIRSLVLDLTAQLRPGMNVETATEVTELILQIAKLVLAVPKFKKIEPATVEDADQCSKINVRWIAIRLRKAVNLEVAKTPKSTIVRTSVFSVLSHLVGLLEPEDLKEVMNCIMIMIAREVTSTDASQMEAHHAANRVAKKMRRQLGSDAYYQMLSEAQGKLQARRANRTKVLLQEKVKDPEKAAKRKLQMKERKKIAKKMKLETGDKKIRKKKRKIEDIDMEDTFLNEE